MATYDSWGNIPHVTQVAYYPLNRHQVLPEPAGKTLLAYGNGRSYGDVCLNDGNAILPTALLDKYISFDQTSGLIRCEAGVSLANLFEVILPRGFFVPVTPGTKYVSIGGMIANDVHGKNHHRAGTFGCHVTQFELLRSDGKRFICTPEQNQDYFAATIGGLGLTGLITWVEVKLKPVQSIFIDAETIPFDNLQQFMEITASSDEEWEYTVAWIDAFAKGRKTGKGIFFRGNHTQGIAQKQARKTTRKVNVPFYFPSWTLNAHVLRTFNWLYSATNPKSKKVVHYDKFFYPLDGIGQWNRIYGTKGFYQYQCVIPSQDASVVLEELLDMCSKANAGSFLSVLKKFGGIKSPGMLSFPREGYTLALDFPNHGKKTTNLLNKLDEVVMRVGGAVYPAKDARMSAESFQNYFPRWQEFSDYIDPGFSSSFWRRVSGVAE